MKFKITRERRDDISDVKSLSFAELYLDEREWVKGSHEPIRIWELEQKFKVNGAESKKIITDWK